MGVCPNEQRNLVPPPSKLYVFDVARARASPTSRLGHSRYSSPSLRRPLCVRRLSQGLRNQNWPLPTTRRSVGMRFSAPDLRASVPAHGRLLQSAPISDRRGGLVGGMSK